MPLEYQSIQEYTKNPIKSEFLDQMNDAIKQLSNWVGIPISWEDLSHNPPILLDGNINIIIFMKPLISLGSKGDQFKTNGFEMIPYPLFHCLHHYLYNRSSYLLHKKLFQNMEDDTMAITENEKLRDQTQVKLSWAEKDWSAKYVRSLKSISKSHIIN